MQQSSGPLLTPENHSLILIDHQTELELTIRSHEIVQTLNNVAFVAQTADIFNIPLLVTTGFVDKNPLIEPLGTIVADKPKIDRTTLNSWEDERIPRWVKEQGRPKLVMAGQWTEVCLLFPVLSALADGYDVYFITDASGGATQEAHDMAVLRMVQAGAKPVTTWSYTSELQRDWARSDEATQRVTQLFAERGGAFGLGLKWQWHIQAKIDGNR